MFLLNNVGDQNINLVQVGLLVAILRLYDVIDNFLVPSLVVLSLHRKQAVSLCQRLRPALELIPQSRMFIFLKSESFFGFGDTHVFSVHVQGIILVDDVGDELLTEDLICLAQLSLIALLSECVLMLGHLLLGAQHLDKVVVFGTVLGHRDLNSDKGAIKIIQA
jgi:hypothetical protein